MSGQLSPSESLEGRMVSMMEKPFAVTVDVLDFIQKNVLNVSEITRTTKLTEILDSYADKKSEEVYIIQNTRNKNSRGVFLNLSYFAQLIAIKQLVEESADFLVEQVALDRIDKVASVGLGEVFERLNLTEEDIADVMKMAGIES